MNDSDGGGRCCSIRKRFVTHTHSVSSPTRSMSLCDKTAFSYARVRSFVEESDLISCLSLKGEIAV